jgi:methyltransferase (TIGR00027 family)
MGRAIAHGNSDVSRYADPTAITLLPEEARRKVEVIRSGAKPKSRREKFERAMHIGRSKMMVARTVVIDDAVREVSNPQLVILGAGLDGRAWRMPELRDEVVFEVDHPDSQRQKRARVATLTQTARDVRFVPVDFLRDKLDDALAAAGHDPSRPTTWIWEGVVMYLDKADIENTLSVIQKRSAPGSRLIIAYHSPALILKLVGFLVKRVGEPLRSAFKADQMREMLGKFGFGVFQDESIASLGARLSPDIGKMAKAVGHLRIVTADRRG